MSADKNVYKFGKEWRKCSKCGKSYPATTEFFSPQIIHSVRMTKKGEVKETWQGLRPDCKECRREEGRIAYHKSRGHYNKPQKKVEIQSGGMGLV